MKKILMIFGLVFFAVGCSCNGEEEENDLLADPITCSDYILAVLEEEGWTQTNGAIFTNDEDNHLVWNISSNVFTYMHDDDHVRLFINNDEIFVGDDYDTNRLDELGDDYDYDELKALASDIHEDLDEQNCPMRGKDHDVFEEEYQDIYAGEENDA